MPVTNCWRQLRLAACTVALCATLLPRPLQAATWQMVPATAPGAKPDESCAPEALPLPPGLVPQVDFWKRVYSELDASHGFLHDASHLGVIYDTITVPPGLSRAAERSFVGVYIQGLALTLEKLAGSGPEVPLSAEEARIRALWPSDASSATLMRAAHNVRYQAGRKEHFLAGLLRARQWLPHIRRVLAERHLPAELAALPHVESSFELHATSKVGAAGIWQFTLPTARRYLRYTEAIDERFDPILATTAAAALLHSNYRSLGSWPLAITAYNHGAAGMRRAVARAGSSDLVTLIHFYRHPSFGFASRNFYAELLAAHEVSSHPAYYFGTLQPMPTAPLARLACPMPMPAASVATALGVSLHHLREHNPALRAAVWSHQIPIPRGFVLHVPPGGDSGAFEQLAQTAVTNPDPPLWPRPGECILRSGEDCLQGPAEAG